MSESKREKWTEKVLRGLDRASGLLDEELVEGQTRKIENKTPVLSEEARSRYYGEMAAEKRTERALIHFNATRLSKAGRLLYQGLSVVICLTMIVLLLYVVSELPYFGEADQPINNEVSARYIESGLQETGAVNIVTGMILDYRAFDTLGESTVLFTAAMVVLLLLRMDAGSENYSQLARAMRSAPYADNFYEPRNDSILQYTAKLLVPLVLLTGIYIVLNGHLSPGGGFSGGAVMGAGLILHVTAYGFKNIRRFFRYRTYQSIVLVSLMTYAVSKCYSFYTGANGIESIIPLGTPGAILSSGLILVLNICVGFIVTCTVYVFYAMFRKGEV